MSARRIPLLEPVLLGNERAYLDECVASGQVSSVGPFVPRFEREFAKRVGAEHAVACASGTAALHLAMLAVGVGPGDDVLVSDLTFIASANPARYCGARVTLVDSEPTGWNLDPALVEAELDRRDRDGLRMPAAIVAVHVFGQLAPMERILAAATGHGVPVIEDAAEALGGQWLSPLSASDRRVPSARSASSPSMATRSSRQVGVACWSPPMRQRLRRRGTSRRRRGFRVRLRPRYDRIQLPPEQHRRRRGAGSTRASRCHAGP